MTNSFLADMVDKATEAQRRRILAQLLEWQRAELKAAALTVCIDADAPEGERWLVQAEHGSRLADAVQVEAATLPAAIDKLAEAEAIRAALS